MMSLHPDGSMVPAARIMSCESSPLSPFWARACLPSLTWVVLTQRAGVDASRSFITGCFQPHHITHDLRGISADDLKVSRHHAHRLYLAADNTDRFPQALDAWKKFFADHAKYEYIGTVSLPPIDPSSPIPGPCVEYDGAQAAAPGAVHGGAAPVPGAGAAREASHNKKSERLKRPNADREL